MEEISRYFFLFGILNLVDLLILSSSTLCLGSGGLTAKTLVMVLLLSPFPEGALKTLVLSIYTDSRSFFKINFGALLVLWFWTLALPALSIVLLILNLGIVSTSGFGTASTIGYVTVCTTGSGSLCTTALGTLCTSGWGNLHKLWLFGAVTTNFTFCPLSALCSFWWILLPLWGVSYFSFSHLVVWNNITSWDLSIGLITPFSHSFVRVFSTHTGWMGKSSLNSLS